jgi:hypothetical protein
LGGDTALNSRALLFYQLAPRIYADLVLGDSCKVRLGREYDRRMVAEQARLRAETRAILEKNSYSKQLETVTAKYRKANRERWIWRAVGGIGVCITSLIVLKPP